MSDHKKNLISADDQKASSISPDVALPSIGESKKKIRKAPKIKKPRKKGLPIAVDILIVIALLAVIAGAVWGVYKIGEFYANKYAPREITYTLLAEGVDASLAFDANGDCVVVRDSEVFILDRDQSAHTGKVYSVSAEERSDGTVDIYVDVSTPANYNYKLGYFVNQIKIAVGKTYTCRFSGLVSDAVIVELQITEKES